MRKKVYTSSEWAGILFRKSHEDEHPYEQSLLVAVAAPIDEIRRDKVVELLILLGERYVMFAYEEFLRELVAMRPGEPAGFTIGNDLHRLTGRLRRAAWEWFTFHKPGNFAKVFQDETDGVYNNATKIGDTIDLSSEGFIRFTLEAYVVSEYMKRIASQLGAEGRGEIQVNSTQTVEPAHTEHVTINTANRAISELGKPWATADELATLFINNNGNHPTGADVRSKMYLAVKAKKLSWDHNRQKINNGRAGAANWEYNIAGVWSILNTNNWKCVVDKK